MEPLNDSTVLLVYGDGRELTVPNTATVRRPPRLTIVPMAPDLDRFVRPIVEIVIAQLVMAHAIENKSFTLEDFLYTQSDTKLVENPVAD